MVYMYVHYITIGNCLFSCVLSIYVVQGGRQKSILCKRQYFGTYNKLNMCMSEYSASHTVFSFRSKEIEVE